MSAQTQLNVCVLEYLQAHNVLCLATTRDNQSWVAPVFYALWRDSFVFLSAPHTRHSRNIQVNPLVSASIQEDYKNWQDIKGIQLEGKVSQVDTQYRQAVIDCYSQKFPVTGADAPAQIAAAIDKIDWYQLLPETMYFIDNARGLGHRDEVDLSLLFKSAN